MNLVPLVSDMAGPPSQTDIEQHFALLEKFMIAFSQKAPIESDLVEGSVVETTSCSMVC